MTKKALITGITGQDGYYLAQLLLRKGYEVHGLIQPLTHDDRVHLQDMITNITFHYGDMVDAQSLNRAVENVRPDELYNLAAQSHVGLSFDLPDYTRNVNGVGVKRLLEAVRIHAPESRFYQAGTSELFGNNQAPQSEQTSFDPQSPYAEGKLEAHNHVKHYREEYGLFAVNGILFNHESPKRGDTFVTQKIIKATTAIIRGQQDCLYLGNLDARRDWGHAEEYVEGMWMMLQQEHPQDFVLATGMACSVRDFVEETFKVFDKKIVWQGKGVDEVGLLEDQGKVIIRVSPEFYRPAEVHELIGNSALAKDVLGWNPKMSRQDLIKDMVEACVKSF